MFRNIIHLCKCNIFFYVNLSIIFAPNVMYKAAALWHSVGNVASHLQGLGSIVGRKMNLMCCFFFFFLVVKLHPL